MFGRRSDGRRLKTIPTFFKVIPCIMPERDDSQVYFKQDIVLSNLDAYIDKKSEAMVRIIAERPYLNRFAMNGSLYARNKIYVSLVIKKNFSDEGTETSIKLSFDGTENIFEIKEKLDSAIEKNKDNAVTNNTDNLAKALSLIPGGAIRLAVKFLTFLDKHGIMPKSIIEASPFHTSVFLTNVGSLGIDSIYHHLYNFGTTSMFFAMGKKKKSYVYDDDEIHEEKCITLAFVGDERICDGYYYATSFKQLSKYLKKPELLETHAEVKQDIE